MNFLKLTPDKLSVDGVTDLVTSPRCGAVSLFVGTTRDSFEDKKVLTLEYEAYEKMAYKAMEKICEETRSKWPNVENIAIYHRLGVVPVKEASVIIGISSPHRADAMQATQWCIDELKRNVTIWKKEVYEESAPQWKENSECPWSALKPTPDIPVEQEVDCSDVPAHLIQITAPSEEIYRRIEKFIERKREQANSINIRDFCGHDGNRANSCARVDSKLVRQKNSKSHLRVHRVFNPQRSATQKTVAVQPFSGVEERLSNIESKLDVPKPISKDIYERIKNIEDKLLYLESISPEYFMESGKATRMTSNNKRQKQRYSVDDIDELLKNITQGG